MDPVVGNASQDWFTYDYMEVVPLRSRSADNNAVPRLEANNTQLDRAVKKLLQAGKLLSACGLDVCVAVAGLKLLQFWTSSTWKDDLKRIMKEAANIQAGLDKENTNVEMFVNMGSESTAGPTGAANLDVLVCEEIRDEDSMQTESEHNQDNEQETELIRKPRTKKPRMKKSAMKKPEMKKSETKKPETKDEEETDKQVEGGVEERYKCDFCDFSTVWKNSLRNHRMKHTGERAHKCPLCDFSAAQSSDLHEHLRVHTGEKPYKCDLCDYQSARSSHLTTHKAVVHKGVKRYKCEFCDYTSAYKKYLIPHMRSHTGDRLACEHCAYTTLSEEGLRVHLRRHTGEKPLKCKYCDYRTAHEKSLYAHLRVHTGDMFLCQVCDYKSNRKGNLQKHMKNRHPKHSDAVEGMVEVCTDPFEIIILPNESTASESYHDMNISHHAPT